jgi:hypothetical protein
LKFLLQVHAAFKNTLNFDISSLKAGSYKIFLTLKNGKEEQSHQAGFNILPSNKYSRKRVKLKTSWPRGFAAVKEDVPLYSALSFSGGTIHNKEKLIIVDENNKEVPCQTEVLSRWNTNGSIKWLGLYFNGRNGSNYSAVFGDSVIRKSKAAAEISTTQSDDLITIDTGAARFELSKYNSLITSAWAEKIKIIENPDGCLKVIDQNNRVGTELNSIRGEEPVIELAGPLCTIVKREGMLRTSKGEIIAGYTVRLYFYAGKSYVRIQHSFINTNDTNKIQYKDIAVGFTGASDNLSADFDNDLKFGNTPLRAGINKNESIFMLQEKYPHHYKTESRYVIGKTSSDKVVEISSGKTAGSWAAAENKEGIISLSSANFAKMCPKELEISSRKISCHLWSSRGGKLLDYRASAVADNFTEDFLKKYRGGSKAFKNIYSNAAGSARTHDLMLYIYPKDRKTLSSEVVSQLIENPVLTIQDPVWLRETDALGQLHPYDAENFPKIEIFLQKYFKTSLVDKADEVGDYGFLDYGNGPHTYDHKGVPRFYRYYEIEYQGRTTMWYAYLRSGDRMYYNYAAAFNRHLNDFLFLHHSKYFKGSMVTSDRAHPLYWAARPSFYGSQGVNLSCYFLHSFITGDKRPLDAVRNYQQRIIKDFNPYELPNKVSGANHPPYECMAELYGYFWNEKVGKKLRIARSRIADQATGSGLVNMNYYGSWYKPFMVASALLKDYELTGSEKAKKASAKYIATMLRTIPQGLTGYQDNAGRFMNYGYRFTGESSYVSWMNSHFDRMRFNYLDKDNNLLKNTDKMRPYVGPWTTTFIYTIPFGLDLIYNNKDKIKAWPKLQLKIADQSNRICFRKNINSEINFSVLYKKPLDILMNKTLLSKDKNRSGGYMTGPVEIVSFPGYFARNMRGDLMGGYAKVKLPKEVLPGEFSFQNVDAVLDSDSAELVVTVPKGIYLDRTSTPAEKYYFIIPAGKSGAIYGNKPFRIEINKKMKNITAGEWQQLESSKSDTVVRIEIDSLTFIRLSGDIPSVIAQGSAENLFIPELDVAPIEEKGVPDTDKTFTTGFTGNESDKAVILKGKTSLKIPRGEALDKSKYLYKYINYHRGTLEFWFKPLWSASMETAEKNRRLIKPCGWEISYKNYLGRETTGRAFEHGFNRFSFTGISSRAAKRQYPYAHQQLWNRISLEKGEWYHFALSWDYIADKKIWISEMYINGKPSLVYNRPYTGMSRYGQRDKFLKDHRVVAGSIPLEFLGEFEAVIDEIRISSIPRYPEPFAEIKKEEFSFDKDTLILLHLNGNTNARTADGTLKAFLENSQK